MLRVALTGNIASGKSAVAGVWRRLGAAIIDADELAREVVEPGSAALERIAAEFGPQVLGESGGLDRAALREIVFRDPEARRRLERITHPSIAALRAQREGRLEKAGAEVVVNDIPLLFEIGAQDDFDVVVLVHSPADVRLARLIENRELARGEAERMIEAQIPSEKKLARADIVIENDGSLDELEARAVEVWRELKDRAGTSA